MRLPYALVYRTEPFEILHFAVQAGEHVMVNQGMMTAAQMAERIRLYGHTPLYAIYLRRKGVT